METRIRMKHCIEVMSFSASFFRGLNRFENFSTKRDFSSYSQVKALFPQRYFPY